MFTKGTIWKVLILLVENCYCYSNRSLALGQVHVLHCRRALLGSVEWDFARQTWCVLRRARSLLTATLGATSLQKFPKQQLILPKKSQMLWMEAEIVQLFVHSLFFKGDMTSLPLKVWPPEKFWHTAIIQHRKINTWISVLAHFEEYSCAIIFKVFAQVQKTSKKCTRRFQFK